MKSKATELITKTKNMFTYVKFKIVKESENPRWFMRGNVGKIFDGRISNLGNHQIKHRFYSDWFDIPKTMVEVQS